MILMAKNHGLKTQLNMTGKTKNKSSLGDEIYLPKGVVNDGSVGS